MVSVCLVFYTLLRTLIPDPDNGHDRRQFVILALNLATSLWTIVLAGSLFVRCVFRQKPNLFTIGNASLIACSACLLAVGAKLTLERIYFFGVEQWASSDRFFSSYWRAFPNFKGNTVSALLDLPSLCAGAVIATYTTLRIVQKIERSRSVFEWCTLTVAPLWLVNWLLTLLVNWLPIRWLTESGTHW